MYNGYILSAKKAAVKQNHATVVEMVAAYATRCSAGGTVQYTNVSGNKSTFKCPDRIGEFVKYMNEHVYGLNFESPYGMGNPSWCKINVTNCSPPGFMSACPSHPDQLGYLSIFASNRNTIKVCSNLEYTSRTVYIENDVLFE